MAFSYSNLYDLRSKDRRNVVQKRWNCKPIRVCGEPLSCLDVLNRLETGAIKIVWMTGMDPLRDFPDPARITRALKQADLVVMQGCFSDLSALDFADVVLPSALLQEKDGTLSDAQRLIHRLQRVWDPPGDVLPDTEIYIKFAEAMGWQDSFAYRGAADIFREFAAFTKNQPVDLSGLSYKRLANAGPLAWPCSAEKSDAPRLYGQGRFSTPSGKARLLGKPAISTPSLTVTYTATAVESLPLISQASGS